MAQLGDISPEQLIEVCGADPGWACERVLDSTGNEALAQIVDFLLARPLKIILIFVGAWVIARLARRGIRRFVANLQGERVKKTMHRVKRSARGLLVTSDTPSQRTAQRAETLGVVLKSVSGGVIYGLAGLMALGEMGLNLGPLVAGAGVAGVALGFGAQSLVKDFLSGVFMLIEDQYGVGDVVDFGEATGVVEGVSLRVTRLRDVYGTVWHVPNGEIHRVGNMSQNWARAVLDVDVAYETDVDVARGVIEEVALAMASDEDWAARFIEPPEVLGVESLGADAVALRLAVKVVPGEQWAIQRELRRRLKLALDSANIEIPFPQRTVWVRNDP